MSRRGRFLEREFCAVPRMRPTLTGWRKLRCMEYVIGRDASSYGIGELIVVEVHPLLWLKRGATSRSRVAVVGLVQVLLFMECGCKVEDTRGTERRGS